MAIPSTSNKTTLFVTRQPAWELRVLLRQAMTTGVHTARSGLEQRSARQSRGRWALQYQAVLDRTQADARDIRTAEEITAPLVVPFWTERTATTSAVVANVVSVEYPPNADFFAAGEWVYFATAGAGHFREIASVAGFALTLVPDVSAPAVASGVTCWPCRLCTRDAGSISRRQAIENSEVETLNFTTL